MDILTGFLSSPEFIALVVAIITAVIGFVGKAARDFIGQKVTAEQLKLLLVIAQQAVAVAEQTGLAKTGEEKKAEAIRVAQTYLDAYGIKVSAAQLAAAIEAAVFNELTQFEKEVEEDINGLAVDAVEGEEATE